MWTQRDPKDNICWSCEVVSDFAGLTVIADITCLWTLKFSLQIWRFFNSTAKPDIFLG